jgi:acylphosphatase
MASLHAVVHGDVQGVGFRYFVQRRAEEAGLAGWVRNLPDGSVELLAEGPRPALERLLDQLGRGPGIATVERIDSDWGEGRGLRGFDIQP